MNQLWEGIKEGFTKFGHALQGLVNAVLLTIVYILGVGLTSIFSKIIGKQFLDMKMDKESTWKDLNIKDKKIEELYRQF